MRTRTLGIALTLAACLAIAPAALQAQFSGTVTGRIVVTDNRSALPQAIRPAAPGQIVGLQGAVVAVRAASSPLNPTRFVVTDANGNFTANWQDLFNLSFPVNVRLEVMMRHSLAAGGGLVAPPTEFEVRIGSNITPNQTFVRSVSSASVNLGVVPLVANDQTAAYLTAREMWSAIVQFSSVLSARMPGLIIQTGVNFNFRTAVSPNRSTALAAPGVPRFNPEVLAHEIGHTITWNALNVEQAPLNPATDFTDGMWFPLARETSKTAFLQGLADLWAFVWAFGSNADVVLPGPTVINFETAQAINATTGQVILNCSTVPNAHEFPFCATAALRDLVDNDPGGFDEGVDLTLAAIANILDFLPNGCFFNGCTNEAGPNALNHNDFLNAAPANLAGGIAAVWALNGMAGGN